MLKKRWWFALVLLVLVGGGVWYASSSPGEESPPSSEPISAGDGALTAEVSRPTPVDTATASIRSVAETLEVHGTLQPVRSVEIVPKVSGRVKEIAVETGDHVEQGQILLMLDDEELLLQVRQAEASVEVAQANLARLEAGPRPQEVAQVRSQVEEAQAGLDQAEDHLRRTRALVESRAQPQSQLEQAIAQHQIAKARLSAASNQLELVKQGARPEEISAAKAQLKQAQTGLDLAKLQLSHTQVTAPIPGVVSGRFVDPGDLASPTRQVVHLVEVNPILIRIELGGRDIVKLHKGQASSVTVDAFPGRSFSGTVQIVESVADSASGLFGARIAVPNPGYEIKPGMAGRVSIVLKTAPDALTVPQSAVIASLDATYLYVVKDGVSVKREIQTGVHANGWVQVTAGLEQGERVVTSGQQFLSDGAHVTLRGSDVL